MSFCVNCGVELADSEPRCPLCGTEVVNPADKSAKNSTPPFPRVNTIPAPHVSRGSLLKLFSLIFLLPVIICVVCDLSVNNVFDWSGFVIGGSVLVYIMTIIPMIPRRPHAFACISLDFISLLAFLIYIEQKTSGVWFVPFALPLTAILTALIIAIVALGIYSSISPLVLSAISIFAGGFFCLATELLIDFAFIGEFRMVWSLYPLVVSALLALILLFIDSNKPLRERLARRFFI